MKTKKFLIILLTLAALAGLLTVLAGAGEWSGSGTETDPYRIGSTGDLLALA